MDPLALGAAIVLLAMLAGLAAFFITSQHRAPKAQEEEQQEEEEADAGQASSSRGRRGNAMDRMRASRLRHRRAQAAAATAADRDDSDGTGSDEDEGEDEEGLTRKEAKRREREAGREAERAAREAKANKVSAYEERRRKKEADREAQERAQEEEIARAAAERQKREDEEAAKWMGMISVEQQGEGDPEGGTEGGGLLRRFVEYIQQRKMVQIEEVAAEFGMRSSEVVDRIHSLEGLGRLTGVMDERGKFIYISKEEMEAVAAFIRKRGRVHIAQLAAQSATLIDLEPKAAAAAVGADGAAIDFDDVLGAGAEE